MKSPLLIIALVLSSTLVPAFAAPKPASARSLKTMIFDASQLKQSLGSKMLFAPVAGTAAFPAEATAALQTNGLLDATELSALPADATRPKRTKAVPPQYPKDLRRAGVSGQAAFLVLVGEDGEIRSLYCYQSSHEAFAQAGAAALAQWKFEPARVNGAAVPVLTSQIVQFETEAVRSTPSKWDAGN